MGPTVYRWNILRPFRVKSLKFFSKESRNFGNIKDFNRKWVLESLLSLEQEHSIDDIDPMNMINDGESYEME